MIVFINYFKTGLTHQESPYQANKFSG